MKKKFLLITAAFLIQPFLSKSLTPVAQKIAGQETSGFAPIQLFEISESTKQQSLESAHIAKSATVMEFNRDAASKIIAAGPQAIRFVIPMNTGKSLELLLLRSNIFTPDFSVVTSSQGETTYSGGLHYHGIVNGNNSSLAAISIFDTDVMGIISTSEGNFNLGILENDPLSRHVYFNASDLQGKPHYECHTQNDNGTYLPSELQPPPNLFSTNCIRIFWEVNYDIYTGKGSVANAVNYVTGLFNQSAIIYTNDGIPVELSEIFVWNTTSPYTSTTPSGLLGQFQNYRNTINGDLGHLVGYAGNGGVAAGFNGLCASNLNSSQCYSKIYSSYSNFPVYSWPVEVVTHEQGHLMGSRHTHACVWNGNNTAIDNCGPTAGYGYEGSCSGAPTPVGGGTIMSYCHLVGAVGINFNNGFGSQPAAVILNNYSNASCLSACIGNACMPPANMYTTAVTTTSATFNWAAVTGATDYNIQYRITGTPTWNTATSATTSHTATGLTPGSNCEWQVQAICSGSITSIFTISTNFITVPTTCDIPTNLSTTNIGSSYATFSWNPASGATSYNIRYRATGSATWITGTTSTTSFYASGLPATTPCEWQVQTVCSGGGTSAYSSSVNFTTTTPPCYPPTNMTTTGITPTSATFNWGTVSGAVSYFIRYRMTGTSTWSTDTTSSLSYTATGLAPSTLHEWQTQSICTGGQSQFGYTITFTTLCNPPTSLITAAGPTSLCPGGSVTLNANTGAGLSYQWHHDGIPVAGATSSSFSATLAGNYTCTVSDACSSAASNTIVVTIETVPATPAVPGGAAIVCRNTTGNGYSVSLVSGATSYTWTAPIGATISSGQGTDAVGIDYGNTAVSGNICVYASNSCGNSSAACKAILVVTTNPTTPSSITGTDLPCANSTGVPYSCPLVANAFSYFWVAPSNATIASGQGTNSITIDFGSSFSSGTVKVRSVNCFGNSSYRNLTVRGKPSTPGVISGPATGACAGTTQSYSIAPVTGASVYTWTAPSNATIGSGQGTTSVMVDFGASFTSGTLRVTAGNICGTSGSRSLTLYSTPTTPGLITGPVNGLCAGTNGVAYSIASVSGASSYLWTAPPNATIATGQGTISVTVDFSAGFTNGTLSVRSVNVCGNSSQRATTVRSVPVAPSSMTGTATVCANQTGVPYSVPAVTGATTYNWVVPTGAVVATGQGTTTVTVNFGISGGSVKAQAVNACGNSTFRTKSVTINCREAVSQNENYPGILLHPNPASEKTILDIETDFPAQVTFLLTDITGRTVRRQAGNLAIGKNSIELDLSGLEIGSYLVLVITDDKTRVLRLIIE